MSRFRLPIAPAAIALALCGTVGVALAQSSTDAAASRVEDPPVAEIGKKAPDFTLKDLDGKEVHLADYKDKIVVLEWFNPGCPVVNRHHEEGALKTTAADLTKEGVVWLAINSGGEGKEGSGVEANRKAAEKWKLRHPILLDSEGRVGHAYGAKTTPHMFVIDAKGVLAYAGAIDNDPRGDKDKEDRVEYVRAAVAALQKGEKVETPTSRPYGCGVKYGK